MALAGFRRKLTEAKNRISSFIAEGQGRMALPFSFTGLTIAIRMVY